MRGLPAGPAGDGGCDLVLVDPRVWQLTGADRLMMGNRWDGTTPTDTRSQRSRTTTNTGSQPSVQNCLPTRVPRRPLFRTVAPYAQPERQASGTTNGPPRRFIPGTNLIESLNARYRRAVKARGHFPTEQAALKCLYLVTRSLDPTGKGQVRWTMRWKPVLNAFAITFGDRFPAAETY